MAKEEMWEGVSVLSAINNILYILISIKKYNFKYIFLRIKKHKL